MAKEKNKDVVSVLSFEKKIVPSDGYMFGVCWDDREDRVPLTLIERSLRGTISNRLKNKLKSDTEKLNFEIDKPNLQRVDACFLSQEHDTLQMDFTLKFLGGLSNPSSCSSESFEVSYKSAIGRYIEKYKFLELSRRYAINIANGRALWRNRLGSEYIEVSVKATNKFGTRNFVFDSKKICFINFHIQDDQVDALAELIALALSSEDDFVIMEVSLLAKIGRAQEVYPSEELIFEKGRGKKSKVLYSVKNQAAMHSQKIGNAIRTIDTWYPDFESDSNGLGPISIEVYGGVTNLGRAFRAPKEKHDFYTFFDRWARGEELEREEDEHYVVAVLIRGGVFGESEKE